MTVGKLCSLVCADMSLPTILCADRNHFQDIVVVTAALEEVKQSRRFARVLEIVLLMGNYMNAGSRNEQTYGFEFSFLPKVSFGFLQVFCSLF